MKMLGKSIIVLLLAAPSLLHASLVLRAYDEQRTPIDQWYVGDPFTLEVILEGIDNRNARPEISNMGTAYIRYSGFAMTTINGKTTMKHHYKVRIDSPGVYTLGPATIVDKQKTISSNVLRLTLKDQPVGTQKEQQALKKSVKNQHGFLRMNVDKETAFVGEKITCTLRFYYTNQVTNITPIQHPPIKDFIMSDQVKTGKGTEVIDGHVYQYLEFLWDVQATQAGSKVIPAYTADFVQKGQEQDYLAHFSSMLGHVFGDKKRTYSNPVAIRVNALPSYKGPVHAIGSYTRITAQLDPLVAHEGDGLTLTIKLEGEGMLNKENYPFTLVGLPDSLKYYDSKQHVDTDKKTYTYEFIIQGIKPGSWQIPAQKFTFFDTKAKKYKTVETQAIPVTILPKKIASSAAQSPSSGIQAAQSAEDEASAMRPLYIEPWQPNVEWALPWWLFLVLLAIPLLLYTIFFIRNYVSQRLQGTTLLRKRLIQKLKTDIKEAAQKREYKKIYDLFINFLSHCYLVSPQQVSPEFIIEKFKQARMSEAERQEWQHFFEALRESVFSPTYSPLEYEALMQQAQRWINRLEEIV